MSAYVWKKIDILHRFFTRKDVKKAMKVGESLAKIAEIFTKIFAFVATMMMILDRIF